MFWFDYVELGVALGSTVIIFNGFSFALILSMAEKLLSCEQPAKPEISVINSNKFLILLCYFCIKFHIANIRQFEEREGSYGIKPR